MVTSAYPLTNSSAPFSPRFEMLSYFPNLEAVITAVEAQFALWAPGNETLRRLCSI